MNSYTLTQTHIDDYTKHLRAEERSATTIEKYLREVNAFILWLNGKPVNRNTIAEWKSGLSEQGYAPATINVKLSALNSLFHFLGWEDCRAKFLKIQRRVFRESSRDLTRQDYEKLVRAAEAQGKYVAALLLETICATGIRVSEVKYITVEAAQRGQANISLKRKLRTILFPGRLCRKLMKYAKKQKIVSGAIFCAKDGSSLFRFQIWRVMKSLCAGAGVEPSKVFPHNLRHLFTATFYRVTRDIVKLADVLDHSSINTTRIYLLSTGAEHARQLERLGVVS